MAVAATAPSDRPNIVFIFTDDHASHAIGAYGSVINETPHLDRLAAEGMLFQNCFVGNSIWLSRFGDWYWWDTLNVVGLVLVLVHLAFRCSPTRRP